MFFSIFRVSKQQEPPPPTSVNGSQSRKHYEENYTRMQALNTVHQTHELTYVIRHANTFAVFEGSPLSKLFTN